MALRILKPFLPLFDPSHPDYFRSYMTFYGGRDSTKSWHVARALLLRGYRRPERVLCFREYQNSIKDSVHKLLSDQIPLLGLQKFYDVQNNGIYGINGTEFFYTGLKRNLASVRSMEGITIGWGEEAQSIGRDSLDTLTPTIRKEGSLTIYTLNPDQPDDPVYHDYVLHPPEDSYKAFVNYDQNIWLSTKSLAAIEHKRRTDPDGFAHVYGGECAVRSKAQIFAGKWREDSFEKPDWAMCMYGADWGFSQDPTVLMRCWESEDRRRLFIDGEYCKIGLEIMQIKEAFCLVEGADKHKIRADSARPETISHVKKAGLNIEGAEKWKGSVEDGIEFLRSYDEIVIHSRCKNMIQEARLYSYKVNPLTGDVLPDIIDKNNHGWDAIRYALAPRIKQSGKSGVAFL